MRAFDRSHRRNAPPHRCPPWLRGRSGPWYILPVPSKDHGRVLIADDEPLARERVRELVRHLAPAAECREVGNGDAAVDSIRDWAPTAVFLDVQMPGLDGFGVVAAVGPDRMPPTAFVTA